MPDVDSLFQLPPFSLAHEEKRTLFKAELKRLTLHHYKGCTEYRRIIDVLGFDPDAPHEPEDYPFLPVRLFKQFDLISVDKTEIVKTLVSSGTSGQAVSRIALDQKAVTDQKKVLLRIAADLCGTERLPMLILDSRGVLKNRETLNARGAGILGFSVLGKNLMYALDEDMNLDLEVIGAFLNKYKHSKILLFGFTFVAWTYFFQALKKRGQRLELENGILIHGGGWKKLRDQSVDDKTFKEVITSVSGIARIHNYYGMVEQTGSIFMECESGHLHCSIYSDIFIRRKDFTLCNSGEPGLIELVSLLPRSYPGHVLLSEDLGEISGEDDCPCGRLGKYFKIHGRIQQAELRGCSDVYSA